MDKLLKVSLVAAGMAFGLGCFAPARAETPKAAAGQKNISIVFDSNTEGLEARQAKSRGDLGDFMAPDLVRVFERYAKSGYTAKLINKKEDFKSGPDEYLLIVKITDYNPGSKAARMIVGFGAGGVKLAIHYDVSANGKETLMANDDSVYSGRDWFNAARKLNESTAKAVTTKLNGGEPDKKTGK